jgi:diguanylate cyclase (GGDEF)-like protein/PAS domain S-box-containing protein
MRYRTLYNSLPSIYFTLNSAGVIFSVSQFGARFLGYTAEELIGQSIFSLVHPHDQERLMGVIELCLHYKPAESLELTTTKTPKYQVICPDGRTLWVRAIATLVPTSNTNPLILLVWEDHTENHELEESISQSERQFRAVFEAALDAMVITDNDGTTVEANPAACTLFALTREELIGCPSANFTEPSVDFEQVSASCPKKQQETGELCLRRPDGTQRIVEYAAIANILPNRHLLVLRSITKPVETPRDTDEELRQYRPQLEQLVAERTVELIKVNQQLQQEILECKQAEDTLKQQQEILHTIINEQEGIPEFQSLGRDITAAKQAEEALRESREKYRVLFQVFPIGICITDKAGKIIEANPASEKILGSLIEEHIQRKYESKQWQIIRPDRTPMPVDEYASVRALKEKRIIENVEQGIVKSGNEITWINVTAAPIPLENYGVAIAYFDITQRKRAEESLRQSEERYRHLFNRGNDAIFVYGFTSDRIPTQYIEVNDIACQILGYTRKELLQLSPLDINASEKTGKVYAIVETLFANKHHLFEMVMQTKDGRKIPVEINAQLFELNGKPTVLSIVRDITERRQTLETLRQQFFRERLMGMIQARIRQSLDLMEILNTTVTEVRQFLQTDRVIIYRFNPDWSGIVIVESVGHQWRPTLGRIIRDTCLVQESCIQPYTQGRIQALEDIYTAGLQACYVNLLAQFQVKANLVVPILQGEKLWGLLVAQHCTQNRPWQPWEIGLLKQLATQVGIAIQQAELYHKLEAANHELKRLATLDGLTQLANRRRFDEYLEQEWRRLARDQKPLSLIMCDIDFFKFYNDTYGHQAGDECLKRVAAALCRAAKRPADLVARYGGEELVVVLPCTSNSGALCVAEYIREEVRNLRLAHPRSNVSPYVTLSLGVAGIIPCLDQAPAVLIAAADAALYEAKAAGRDRTVLRQLN